MYSAAEGLDQSFPFISWLSGPRLFPQKAMVCKTHCISQTPSLSSQLTTVASWVIWSRVEWVSLSHCHMPAVRATVQVINTKAAWEQHIKCCPDLAGPAFFFFSLCGWYLLFHFWESQHCLVSSFLALSRLSKTEWFETFLELPGLGLKAPSAMHCLLRAQSWVTNSSLLFWCKE